MEVAKASRISNVASQIAAACNRINVLASAFSCPEVSTDPQISQSFSDQLEGQIADVQQLVLLMSGVAYESNADEGSVFAEGELDVTKDTPETDCIDPNGQ